MSLLRFMRPAVTMVMIMAFAVPGGANPSPSTTISSEVGRALDQVAGASGPGVAVLIAQGDRTLYRSAKGIAEVELGVRLTPDQVFHIASVTKMFTAALVLKLADAGKLSLDDPLARFLPDFSKGDSITIRELLSHTAGISDKTLPSDAQPGFSCRDVSMATLVNEIAKRPSNFAPGTNQDYSNSGYILLGAVIEKITGQPWHAAMGEQLFQPFSLKHTSYGIASSVIAGRVAGYTSDTPGHVVANAPFISMTIPASAGALVSTLDDLHRWMRALTGGRVLSAASYRQMITPARVAGMEPTHPYGLGMYVWRVRGETMIGHTGQINGFASILAYVPSRDATIVALGNNDNFDAQNFGRQLAAIVLGKPYPKAVEVSVPLTVMRALAGVYQEGAFVRTITVNDGKLYAQRGGGNVVPLQMTAHGQLHFVPDELSYFMPVRDKAGSVVRLDYFEHGDGPPKALPRITAAVR